jgi:hypothetical protein
MEELREKFLTQLIKNYGEWDKNSARFGTYSYGEIADELCISSSQFSKLLYGSATNGMYERSIKNIEQLKRLNHLHQENQRLTGEVNTIRDQLSESSTSSSVNYRNYVLIAIISFIIGIALISALRQKTLPTIAESTSTQHPLNAFFDRDFKSDFVSPFLDVREAQQFCPCSAFEGVWELDKEYVIPIPNKKPGVYYLAKAVDMRVKCYRNVETEKKGKMLLGFENMIHELWIDTKREPLSPKYFNLQSKNFTKEYYNIDFENDPSFQRIATINSFMFNTFEIGEDYIFRRGEPAGRYAENINHKLANEYEIDIKAILENIIGNLVKTVCEPSVNYYCNPNTLIENESTIKFDCNFTIQTENLGIGGSYPYTKGFKLVEQNYSDNLLCNCKEN